IQWHAHEMFFGFGWAVLGGFLLTSTKNWVGIRGYHGASLLLLTAAWIVERLGMSLGGHWPLPLFLLANSLFLVAIVAMLLWTLIRHRQRDSYRSDNGFFLLMLPAFIVAKHLLLAGDFAAGSAMSIGLFRLAFLIMLERTLTQFMKAAFQVEILRQPWLDMSIKLLGLCLALEFLLPSALAAALALTLAALLAIRFCFWKPQRVLRRIDIGIMYIGYLLIVLQLLVDACGHLANLVWVGSLSVHLFTVGVMGCIAPAMMIRIAKGHTGRKVAFAGSERLLLYLMLATLLFRVGLPQLFPAAYLGWIHLSASTWALVYGVLAWRVIPLLTQPRIDGREH
ncbi:MAG: NnrS family protein, partial [Betaproteobacteria bacterium]|nr:NnrS family protein [Betaproteobacteria bacterium]